MTQKQTAVLAFIRMHQKVYGYSPSSREIQEHFGFASQTAAMNHLRALERKGIIRTTPRVARSIVVLE